MPRIAIFTSTLVVEYDPDNGESPEDGLDTYLADHDVSTSFELIRTEPHDD